MKLLLRVVLLGIAAAVSLPEVTRAAYSATVLYKVGTPSGLNPGFVSVFAFHDGSVGGWATNSNGDARATVWTPSVPNGVVLHPSGFYASQVNGSSNGDAF